MSNSEQLNNKKETEMNEHDRFIGMSLSACIRDILEGKVKKEQVQLLVTGTMIKNQEDFEKVCEIYQESAWYKFPKKATELARWFWENGLIIQPRLQFPEIHHFVGAGHWAKIGYLENYETKKEKEFTGVALAKMGVN